MAGLIERVEAGEEVQAMTPEEKRFEDLRQQAAYAGPVVSFDVNEPYYLASCDGCGWVGSSELCGTDSFGGDSDVYCPRCFRAGADCGAVASRIGTQPLDESAALVPDGWGWAAGNGVPHEEPWAWCALPGEVDVVHADTPALALQKAALRAREATHGS